MLIWRAIVRTSDPWGPSPSSVGLDLSSTLSLFTSPPTVRLFAYLIFSYLISGIFARPSHLSPTSFSLLQSEMKDGEPSSYKNIQYNDFWTIYYVFFSGVCTRKRIRRLLCLSPVQLLGPPCIFWKQKGAKTKESRSTHTRRLGGAAPAGARSVASSSTLFH